MRQPLLQRILQCFVAGSLLFLTTEFGVTGGLKNPIKKPKYDASAEAVELFEGVNAGQFSVTMISKSEFEASIFIENKTKKPLTVKLPSSAVGVQVLKQGFGGGGMGAGGMGGGGMGGGGMGGMNSMGGNGQAQ